jgi:hypothetical protein
MYALEYYNQAFALFHRELTRSGYGASHVHPIRKRFWQFVPPGEYDLQAGRSLLQTYLRTIEGEMRETIARSSLAYWLHLYRRLSPGPIGEDTSPTTIGLTRAVLESAIQKYARLDPCERIRASKDVPMEQVLDGLPMTGEFKLERKLLAEMGSQLVLTRFTHAELAEFYDLERLAYETWRVGAILRSIGKGAPFVVEGDPAGFSDNRSDELADLLKYYDERTKTLRATAAGVVFDPLLGGTLTGHILLPTYNLGHITSESMKDLLKVAFKMEFVIPIAFNFLWIPFDLRRFRDAHLPLGEAFREKHCVSLDAVLAVIASLCVRTVALWTEKGPEAFLRHWQRAYEGPMLRKDVWHEIRHFLPAAEVVKPNETVPFQN